MDYSLPIKSLTEWFTKDEVENKRNNIATLIRDLAATQNPGKQFTYPQLNFFNPPQSNSGTDTDDEDNPKKEVPKWAEGAMLRTALLKQSYMGPNPDEIFFMRGETPDLSAMFTHQRKR